MKVSGSIQFYCIEKSFSLFQLFVIIYKDSKRSRNQTYKIKFIHISWFSHTVVGGVRTSHFGLFECLFIILNDLTSSGGFLRSLLRLPVDPGSHITLQPKTGCPLKLSRCNGCMPVRPMCKTSLP